MFSQVTIFCSCDKCLGAVCHRTTIQRDFERYETLRTAQEIDDPGIDDSFRGTQREYVYFCKNPIWHIEANDLVNEKISDIHSNLLNKDTKQEHPTRI